MKNYPALEFSVRPAHLSGRRAFSRKGVYSQRPASLSAGLHFPKRILDASPRNKTRLTAVLVAGIYPQAPAIGGVD